MTLAPAASRSMEAWRMVKRKPGGSRKGIPNKTTKEVKDMVLATLKSVGGETYLRRLARNEPTLFVPLVARLIPTRIGGEPGNPVEVRPLAVHVNFVDPAKLPAPVSHRKYSKA